LCHVDGIVVRKNEVLHGIQESQGKVIQDKPRGVPPHSKIFIGTRPVQAEEDREEAPASLAIFVF